jgi:ABC-2 type transport system permease protein
VSADLRTVLWKEWRSLMGGRARRQLLVIGGVLAAMALIFPIEDGRGWVSDPVGMGILGIVMPMLVVSVIVPDAIAGERERHTLATLLATRLPDRAILYGKLGFAVVTGWLTGIVMLAVSLVAANLSAAPPAPLLYEPEVLLAVLALGFLVAILAGGIGFFVSLRASTAQEAQQLTGVGMMVPLMLASFLLMAVMGNDDLRAMLAGLGTLDPRLVVVTVMAVITIVDGALLVAADRRFRRGRLLAR